LHSERPPRRVKHLDPPDPLTEPCDLHPRTRRTAGSNTSLRPEQPHPKKPRTTNTQNEPEHDTRQTEAPPTTTNDRLTPPKRPPDVRDESHRRNLNGEDARKRYWLITEISRGSDQRCQAIQAWWFGGKA
jgi:hypothetical protein